MWMTINATRIGFNLYLWCAIFYNINIASLILIILYFVVDAKCCYIIWGNYLYNYLTVQSI